METAGVVLALVPVAILTVLLALAVRRQLWSRLRPRAGPLRPSAPPGRPPALGGGRHGPAGVREPRRPLVPSAAGAAALPLPDEPEHDAGAVAASGAPLDGPPDRRRLAG
jgi:hypothetical protein